MFAVLLLAATVTAAAVSRAGATANALAAPIDLGKDGTTTITRFAISVLGEAGAASSRATSRSQEMAARRDDAIALGDALSRHRANAHAVGVLADERQIG